MYLEPLLSIFVREKLVKMEALLTSWKVYEGSEKIQDVLLKKIHKKLIKNDENYV